METGSALTLEGNAVKTWAKVLDWIGVAIFGAGALVMARFPQASPLAMLIHLLPFGTALIAFRPDSSRMAVVSALVLNGLWLAGIAATVVFAVWSLQARDGMYMTAFMAALAAPCLLNILALVPSKSREPAAEPAPETSFAP